MRPRKARTREQYILESLPTVFKGGEWLEEPSSNGGEGVSDRGDGDALPAEENYEQTLYVTVVGGQKYDDGRFWDHMLTTVGPAIVGEGRGVERDLAKSENFTTIIVPVDPDCYGKNARKVNVEQVLSFAPESPLLLVGEGERVKQARAWLKRARWPREVIELP